MLDDGPKISEDLQAVCSEHQATLKQCGEDLAAAVKFGGQLAEYEQHLSTHHESKGHELTGAKIIAENERVASEQHIAKALARLVTAYNGEKELAAAQAKHEKDAAELKAGLKQSQGQMGAAVQDVVGVKKACAASDKLLGSCRDFVSNAVALAHTSSLEWQKKATEQTNQLHLLVVQMHQRLWTTLFHRQADLEHSQDRCSMLVTKLDDSIRTSMEKRNHAEAKRLSRDKQVDGDLQILFWSLSMPMNLPVSFSTSLPVAIYLHKVALTPQIAIHRRRLHRQGLTCPLCVNRIWKIKSRLSSNSSHQFRHRSCM